jgi:polar amino acid transport system substrate-binding protein
MGHPVTGRDLASNFVRANRRLFLAALLSVAVVLAGVWVVGQLNQPDDAVWARIQSEKVWLVATDASYPPFSAVDGNGDLFGFDVDLAEGIARRWGATAAFENITYDALLGSLIAGRDQAVVSAFVPQPERTREVAYTRPYFTAGTVAVVRQAETDLPGGDAVRWAAGKTFAVEYGSGGDALARQWARRVVGVGVLPLPTAAEALVAVEKGQADAALVDAISAYEYLLSHPELKLAGPPLEPEPYVIAVNVKSQMLLREIDMALAAMEADGSLDALKVKWFGEAAAGQ